MSAATPHAQPDLRSARARARRTPGPLWALPLVLSLFFVWGVIAWVQRADHDEREELRKTMITDALSLEARLRDELGAEKARLGAVAATLHDAQARAGALDAQPDVAAGLRRVWVSVTWIDPLNRIVDHVPRQLPPPSTAAARLPEEGGLSMHLSMPVESSAGPAGVLIARFSPTQLLKRGVPWWLIRRYDVVLVDGSEQVIASTADSALPAAGDRYRIAFGAAQDTFLQLTQRDVPRPWYRSLPLLVLIGGFLLLIGGATALLRRQVRQVLNAEASWRSEAAWRSAIEDSALVGLRVRDDHGRVLSVNRTFCDMVGFKADELIGQSPPMPYWPPDAIDEVMWRMRRNFSGQAPREGYEASWRHRDGHLLDVMVYESALVDASGQQIGWMGSIIDITKRRQLEERERRQTETMAHHARLTMLGEVASTLAHELNQPLMAISSYGAGIANSLQREGYADAVVLGALERLAQQAAHAGRIVHRIRQFLTRREPQHEVCALNQVIRDAVALLQRELARRGVRLSFALDEQLPPLVADQVLIEQVVINLVRNAADALATQTGERLIRVASSAVAASDGGVARFVRVDVVDNGPGLGGQGIDTLCAPFFSTKRDGMGMGLAICRSIIEAHHGVLDAAEGPGGGARFSFNLPVATPAQPGLVANQEAQSS